MTLPDMVDLIGPGGQPIGLPLARYVNDQRSSGLVSDPEETARRRATATRSLSIAPSSPFPPEDDDEA
jgi:hypothetical protein